MGGMGFLTVLVHSKLRNYGGHETRKTREISEGFFIPSFSVYVFLL